MKSLELHSKKKYDRNKTIFEYQNRFYLSIKICMDNQKMNSRRNFLKQSGVLVSAAILPISSFSMANNSKFKMGLQLFTIRDAMAEDPISTLKKVRVLGYEDSELFGYDGKNDTFYGLKSKDFKKVIDDLDFTVTSGHYDFSSYFTKPFEKLEGYLEQCIEGSHAIGAKYITWPWLAPEFRTIDNFKRLAEKLNKMGELVNKSGLGFAYHNHDFEFTDHHGENGYDIILDDTDAELVKLQMDMYWVEHSSKKSPKQLIEDNPGRYVMWHIKDMDKVTRDYTELGNGSIDYVKMLSEIKPDALQYYYLEQGGNFTHNSMQSITDSAAYFKKNLQKFL